MDEKKDFLSQFSSDGKTPDSFKQEERVKIVKEKKPIDKKILIIIPICVVIVIVLAYFLFFRPNIAVPDFVGKNISELTAWVKQQGIDSTGIIVNKEYNFDYENEVITSQDIKAGKKVKKNVKMTLIVSLGADPDELINVPDLENMDKESIQKWIKDNKLINTKINTTYSDTVEENNVISVNYSGVDKDTFTRGSNLKISISKGKAPAGNITMEDFSNKSYDDIATWAKNKKINLIKEESFSDTVIKNLIISTSVLVGKTLKENDNLTVYVSKGKGLTVPDFSKMNNADLEDFKFEYKLVNIRTRDYYSSSPNYIVDQSVKAGNMIAEDDSITLTINKGNGFYLEDEGIKLDGSADKVDDFIPVLKDKGINMIVDYHYRDSSLPKGSIIRYEIRNQNTDQTYSAIEKLPLNVEFDLYVSKGDTSKYYYFSQLGLSKEDIIGKSYDEASDKFASLSSKGLKVEVTTDASDTNNKKVSDMTITSTSDDGTDLTYGFDDKLPENIKVKLILEAQ